MQQNALIDNLIMEGLPQEFYRSIESCGSNAQTINNYLNVMKTEVNLSIAYKKITIKTLVYLSKFLSNKKFKLLKRRDIITFLDSKKKSDVEDPLHCSIGTYNLYIVILTRFFKWVYYPKLSAKERPKPPIVDIPKLRRREQSIYKPTDLWTQDDDLLFLKYCSSKRDRCYHAMSRDSSCRPHELLKLKIKDVIFKMAGDRQYAEILVNGKTGQRHIPLINSLPYLKDWLDDHPQSGNPNAILICGFDKSLGEQIGINTINHIYCRYKNKIFPKLLENPNVPSEDKEKIKELLKKRWNPYIRRHSALTEKSKILKESILRQHAGWSPTSNMHQKYIHYFGNESSESILEAYGLKPKLEETDKLRPVSCPNCNELNKFDSKFCVKCRMILSYDAYTEALEDSEEQKSRMDKLTERFEQLETQFKKKDVQKK